MILGCRLLAKVAAFNAYRIIVQQLRNKWKKQKPIMLDCFGFWRIGPSNDKAFWVLVSINDRIFISSNIG
jgi:hypothetical protein